MPCLSCARFAMMLVLPWVLAARMHAGDWPQFRGPNRDAAWNETGLLRSFPADGLKIRWRSPVGWGWSSPVVAQGCVFVTDSELKRPAAKERVHCFDETGGKPLWTFAYDVAYPDWVFVPGQESGPTATPITDAGKVYTLGANGQLHCLDARTGAVLWARDLGKEYQIREFMCRASPLIEGDLLILFTGGKPGACVIALDKNSGKEVWKALTDAVSNSSPLVIVAGGMRQLIVWTGQAVTSLNPKTGQTYWREPLVTSNDDAIASPVFHNPLLLVGGLMFELGADQPTASILWPATRAASHRILSNTSTALLREDYVYSAKSSGEFVCLEARTGRQVWKTDKVTTLKGGASIHPTAIGNDTLLFTDKGEVIRAKLTPAGYKELSRARVLEPTYPFAGRKVAWAPPAYANRRIFARSDKELVCASLAAEP